MMDRTAGRVWTTEGAGDTEKLPEPVQSEEPATDDAAGDSEESAISDPDPDSEEIPSKPEPKPEAVTAESRQTEEKPAADEPERTPEQTRQARSFPEEPRHSEPEPKPEPRPKPKREPDPKSEPDPEPKTPPVEPPSPPRSPDQVEKRRVLVVYPAASTGRLIRETLENFTAAEVDTSPDTIYGFELALKRRYHLFIFGLVLPQLDGPLLYELISKTHPHCHGGTRTAPGVVFVREESDPRPSEEISRDPRVKAILTKPLSIERLLQAADGALERRAPI